MGIQDLAKVFLNASTIRASGLGWRGLALMCEKPSFTGALLADFNPIETAFAKLKALLRKAAERTVDHLWTTIGRLLDLFKPAECRNYFATAGYDAT
jgi:hypothetical protein